MLISSLDWTLHLFSLSFSHLVVPPSSVSPPSSFAASLPPFCLCALPSIPENRPYQHYCVLMHAQELVCFLLLFLVLDCLCKWPSESGCATLARKKQVKNEGEEEKKRRKTEKKRVEGEEGGCMGPCGRNWWTWTIADLGDYTLSSEYEMGSVLGRRQRDEEKERKAKEARRRRRIHSKVYNCSLWFNLAINQGGGGGGVLSIPLFNSFSHFLFLHCDSEYSPHPLLPV